MNERRVIDGSELSPAQRIDLLNSMQGRAPGLPGVGYFDDEGNPITPPWAQGEATMEVPVSPAPTLPQAGTPVADTRTAPVAEVANQRGATIETPEHVLLEDGRGMWRDNMFTLTPKELKQVQRVVVGAIRRQLREQEDTLVKEVGGLLRGKPRGTKKGGKGGEAETVDGSGGESAQG